MATARIDTETSERIRRAVEEAELASGGEIVPVLVGACDDYALAPWRGGVLGALLGDGAVAIWSLAGPSPWLRGALWWLLPGLAGLALGAVAAATIPSLKRWLAGEGRMRRHVEQAASERFLAHEVFRTRDRTGILILVASFERQVTVLADAGIRARVPEASWQELAAATAAQVRREGPGPALLAAVRRAGELMASCGVPRRPDDRNELPDAPQLEP